MNRAFIKTPDGRLRSVKNLGWLLRNWQSIKSLEWTSLTPETRVLISAHPMTDGVFKGYMRDGTEYSACYASFDVWKRFIDRPIFRGLEVVVNGMKGTV